ncbi:cytochrome c3 family protein [Bacteroidota bacterium]
MKRDLLNYVKLLFLFKLLIIFSTNYSFAENLKDAEQEDHISHDSDDLKLGERLFFGLIKTGDNTVNCASCHNTAVVDTFNWNPSALELAFSTQQMDSVTFANTLLNPVTKRISEVHENIHLNAEQVLLIRHYIDTYRTNGLEESKILATNLAFLIFLVVLFLAAFIDLSITKIIKFKLAHGLVMLIALTFILKITVHSAIGLGRTKDYAPLQPIKFSHKVHATDNKIDCIYCHHTAETAKSAGIPSTNVCLNCHELVREGTNSGRFEIKKILTNVENGTAPKWFRIHKLPDHVYFNHSQHVEVAKLECAECHGPIKDNHLASQYAELSMGWCLDCHRTKKVDFLGNDYYSETFEEYHEKFKNNQIDSLTVAELGGENCMKCHY